MMISLKNRGTFLRMHGKNAIFIFVSSNLIYHIIILDFKEKKNIGVKCFSRTYDQFENSKLNYIV